MKKIKDIVELVKLVNKLNTFNPADVDLILRCPHQDAKVELLGTVTLNDKEQIVYQSHYSDGLTNDNVARKLAIDVRQVERIKTQLKAKCHAVWQYNLTAITLIKHLKVEQLEQLCLQSFSSKESL